ncbi:MAG: FKBP-type peptidyl-prolyl cis-trans isomerase [Thermoplasmatota archaeon]|jgi:peptidylprolyl isomerase
MVMVKKGDKIKVEYEGMLEDGTVFDSSASKGCPLEFEVGAGLLLKKFEEAVIGMNIGEEKEITLSPKEAYGEHKPEFLKEISKKYFPEDQEIQPGMFFMMVMQNGRKMPVKISSISDDSVVVDLNHPLAGKTLIFKIKVVEIID